MCSGASVRKQMNHLFFSSGGSCGHLAATIISMSGLSKKAKGRSGEEKPQEEKRREEGPGGASEPSLGGLRSQPRSRRVLSLKAQITRVETDQVAGRKWAFTGHAVRTFPAQRPGVTETSAPVHHREISAVFSHTAARISIKGGTMAGEHKLKKVPSDPAKCPARVHPRTCKRHTSDASWAPGGWSGAGACPHILHISPCQTRRAATGPRSCRTMELPGVQHFKSGPGQRPQRGHLAKMSSNAAGGARE